MNYRLKGSDRPVRFAAGVPQYFFDDTMIAFHRRVSRKWMQADPFPQPAVVSDRPWEGRVLRLFGTVIPVEDEGYRMYYSDRDFERENRTQRIMAATSADGLTWVKPELDEVLWNGSGANNIVVYPSQSMDAPSVIYEAGVDAPYPWKMLTTQRYDSSFAFYTYRSRDGWKWETHAEGPRLLTGDRTNVFAGKQEGKYAAYTRARDMHVKEGKRCIYRSESDNFADWSEPELVLEPGLDDDADVEFYGMSVFARHGWYFGLVEYWRSSRDVMEIHLVHSRDGKTWSKPNPHVPFIAGTHDWNRKWNSCASNGPIVVGSTMVFYVGGRYNGHLHDWPDTYGAIGYATLPVDRFCALEAASEGEFITAQFVWPGGELRLNADTRESFESHRLFLNGEIGVDVLDADGSPVSGWSGEHGAVFKGNTHGMNWRESPAEVQWTDGKSFDQWKDRTIRLRFRMRHARLYTMEAGEGRA